MRFSWIAQSAVPATASSTSATRIVRPGSFSIRRQTARARSEVNSYEYVLFGIGTLAEGKLIGVVTLRDATPEQGRAEIDIYIGEKDHWGGGYGTDAMRTICRYGFDMMRLHMIALWVVAENESALHVYKKIGFQVDGRHRQSFRGPDGQWHDEILMSLLEGELV